VIPSVVPTATSARWPGFAAQKWRATVTPSRRDDGGIAAREDVGWRAAGESEAHRTAGGGAAGSADSNSFTRPETHRRAGGEAAGDAHAGMRAVPGNSPVPQEVAGKREKGGPMNAGSGLNSE